MTKDEMEFPTYLFLCILDFFLDFYASLVVLQLFLLFVNILLVSTIC